MWNLFTRFFKCRHLIWLSILCAAFAGCKDDFDDSELRDQIADLDGRLTTLEKLCAQMNTNISSMQTIVNALQQNDYITGVTPIMEGGNTIGYTITFMKNKPITIYHGKDGEKGKDGITPRFKIENGRWMVSRDNGSTWEDAGQATGDQGLPGVAGITPKLKIENGRWLISWDNGASWEDVGQATGDQGQQGAAGITPQFKIEFGNWFVSFDHGTNWSLLGQATGDKGEDGITPVIGIKQDTDGIYYWTLNGTWLLDDNNQKVKAEGTDGKNGKPGENGTPGKDGITPLLKIEGGYWYVSYDNENSWKQLGKATGECEENFFQEITEDEDYVYIILTSNQTTISIPKYKPLSITFNISENFQVLPNEIYSIDYTLGGYDSKTIVKALAQDGFRVVIKSTDLMRGVIEVTTPETIVDSEILVFVSNEKGTIVRSIKLINDSSGSIFTETVLDVSFDMVYVKGGTFLMGATPEQENVLSDDEKPVHKVTLSDYYIGKYQVTQKLWKAVMGENPSKINDGDNYPVENISWNDTQIFLNKLNELTGKNYVLPTEAQWEFAARGGNKSKGYQYSGSNNIYSVASWYFNSFMKVPPVGSRLPNELGIYDMSGYTGEWCRDYYHEYTEEDQTNPIGAPLHEGSQYLRDKCVIRSNIDWGGNTGSCRVSHRSYAYPEVTSLNGGSPLGCRLALEL